MSVKETIKDFAGYVAALAETGDGLVCVDYMDGRKICAYIDRSKTKFLPEKGLIGVFARSRWMELRGEKLDADYESDIVPIRIEIGRNNLVTGNEDGVLDYFLSGLPETKKAAYRAQVTKSLQEPVSSERVAANRPAREPHPLLTSGLS